MQMDMPPSGTIVSRTAQEFGLPMADVFTRLRKRKGQERLKLQVARWDDHPNEETHRLLADEVRRALEAEGLLP